MIYMDHESRTRESHAFQWILLLCFYAKTTPHNVWLHTARVGSHQSRSCPCSYNLYFRYPNLHIWLHERTHFCSFSSGVWTLLILEYTVQTPNQKICRRQKWVVGRLWNNPTKSKTNLPIPSLEPISKTHLPSPSPEPISQTHPWNPSLEPISRTHPWNPSPEPISRTHLLNPSLEPIFQTHLSNPSPKPISRTHLLNPSLKPISRTHLLNPSLKPISRTHLMNPSLKRSNPYLEPIYWTHLSNPSLKPISQTRLSNPSLKPIYWTHLSKWEKWFWFYCKLLYYTCNCKLHRCHRALKSWLQKGLTGCWHVTWHDSCYCYMLILNGVGKSVCDGPGLCTWVYWWSTGCLAHVKRNVYKKNISRTHLSNPSLKPIYRTHPSNPFFEPILPI